MRRDSASGVTRSRIRRRRCTVCSSNWRGADARPTPTAIAWEKLSLLRYVSTSGRISLCSNNPRRRLARGRLRAFVVAVGSARRASPFSERRCRAVRTGRFNLRNGRCYSRAVGIRPAPRAALNGEAAIHSARRAIAAESIHFTTHRTNITSGVSHSSGRGSFTDYTGLDGKFGAEEFHFRIFRVSMLSKLI
ncbi:hypothetical protein EVAR_67122_1 [Eumeta japonica]|uniref:Uncharacterized protein n=1 Tax=Eumeta variegata TaxID=151549 RepID=A0A4C1ZW68_EUMVA|nr:hypothetical protein EVAR_67122_1 [Eumeta japonica]